MKTGLEFEDITKDPALRKTNNNIRDAAQTKEEYKSKNNNSATNKE